MYKCIEEVYIEQIGRENEAVCKPPLLPKMRTILRVPIETERMEDRWEGPFLTYLLPLRGQHFLPSIFPFFASSP